MMILGLCTGARAAYARRWNGLGMELEGRHVPPRSCQHSEAQQEDTL
jgi:hypothetical protein